MGKASALSDEKFNVLQQHAESVRVKAVRTLEAITLFHTGNDIALNSNEFGIGANSFNIIQSRLMNSAVLEAYAIFEEHRRSDDATLTRLYESLNQPETIRRLLEFAVEWGNGERAFACVHVKSMRRQLQKFRRSYRCIGELDTEALKTFRDKRLAHNSLLEEAVIPYSLAWKFCDRVIVATHHAVFIFSGIDQDWEGYKELYSESYNALLATSRFDNRTDNEED